VVRLSAKDDWPHFNLGVALGNKGDWDGAVAEYRDAVRLNPNNGFAYYSLGFALETKGDLRGALEEYRAIHMLNPENADFKQAYERLLQQVNQR
jgi:tetratricopeptide (TPR) repeat protein